MMSLGKVQKEAMEVGKGDEDDQSKAVMLFGRDIRKIPCFKQSMLNGIYGGVATGLATFMFTSRARLSTNVAMGSYMGIVVVYWCYCRYNYVMQKYALQDLQNVLRETGTVDELKEVGHEHQKKLIDT
ncbi:cytochrome c oxidase assembly protein COX20, mitochondrial [Monomorium pharaonis]|uniref:cytochrome c oxidase assembly protein COX20, mitochondrial n=1 Tax=Monomorium pharaonis TaxID=307658 RepID=UPI0017464AAC|nr:cytochrome c oxidase assembly protein COX20, mitochondrial [Monomorium pharaonis]